MQIVSVTQKPHEILAARLVETLGRQTAIRMCLEHQWLGVKKQIEAANGR